jgi:hypothetical protein
VNPKTVCHVYARVGARDVLNRNTVHLGSLLPEPLLICRRRIGIGAHG